MNNKEFLLEKPKQELVKIIRGLEKELANSTAYTDIMYEQYGIELNPLEMSVIWRDKKGNVIKFTQEGVEFDVDTKFKKKHFGAYSEFRKSKVDSQEIMGVCPECGKKIALSLPENQKVVEVEKDNKSSKMLTSIEIANTVIQWLENMYKENNIYLMDNDSELFDNDLRHIAKHLLVEIGDM